MPRHTVQQQWISNVTTATVFGLRTVPGDAAGAAATATAAGLHGNDARSSSQGRPESNGDDGTVYFKKKEQESAVEAEI